MIIRRTCFLSWIRTAQILHSISLRQIGAYIYLQMVYLYMIRLPEVYDG